MVERDEAAGAGAPAGTEAARPRFAGGRATPPRAARDDDSASDRDPPERMVLVPLVMPPGPPADESAEARCLLVRLRDAGRTSLLELPAPAPGETLAAVVADVLHARLGVRPVGEPRLAAGRVAARLPRERRGTWDQGWLRTVVVSVEGEPAGDALVDDVLVLSFEEAARALPTDAERRLLMLASS